MKKAGIKKNYKRRELPEVEAILQSRLKPVSPRPEFIQSLQKGLMDNTFPEEEYTEIDLLKAVIFAFIGFSGLVFIFSMWIRLIIVIISSLGMIQSRKKRSVPQ